MYNHLIIIYIYATVYCHLLGSPLDVVIHCVAFIDFATCQFLVAAVRNLSLLIRCEKERHIEMYSWDVVHLFSRAWLLLWQFILLRQFFYISEWSKEAGRRKKREKKNLFSHNLRVANESKSYMFICMCSIWTHKTISWMNLNVLKRVHQQGQCQKGHKKNIVFHLNSLKFKFYK